jgi:ethylbenzene dioxygenase beta subunit
MGEQQASNEVYIALQRQLYQEARLLSSEQYDDWLAMVSEDIHYAMEMPQRRFREDKGHRVPDKTPIFNDDMTALLMRVGRFKTGFVWSENPINSIRHIVSNVEVFETEIAGQYKVYSVIEVHRSRLDAERKRLTAGRQDIWQQTATGYQLLKRNAVLDDGVVLDSNINFFF